MGDVLSDPDTTLVDAGGQVSVDSGTHDVVVTSGGAGSSADARVLVGKPVPGSWTLQVALLAESLPDTFGDLTLRHVFIGASDGAGPCGGVFISRAGLAYTGAISHDGAGTMRLDSALEPLPDSQSLIQLGKYITFRIAADIGTGAVYIYVTDQDQIAITGHRLRYVMPAIMADTLLHTTSDQVQVSVRGAAIEASTISIDQMCLATGLVIPNLQPIADAGIDQASQLCSIVALDGSRSFDPEGALLTYRWGLIDAPHGSSFANEFDDSSTFPASGFTDKIYSVEAATANALDAFQAGDRILVRGLAYEVAGVGTDGHGFFIQATASAIPDDVTNESFKLLRQRGIAAATTAKPTFLPDVAGLYKFELTVDDGDLESLTSLTVVNVLDSPVPRGCSPDLGFIWRYLSDFWRLVDGRERIDTFFESVAQVAASELLTVWQVDYAKSLRDIQRTVQRRWLHYDLMLAEPLPELTVVRQIWAGVLSSVVSGGGISASGAVLELTSDLLGAPLLVTVVGTNPMTATQIAQSLNTALQFKDQRFSASVVPTSGGAGLIRINAQVPFTIGAGTTLSVFTVGGADVSPAGTGGVKVGPRTYQVPMSLDGLGVVEGDILSVGGNGYRIARVVDDPTDALRYQRVVLQEDLGQLPGPDWAVSGHVLSRLLDFWSGLVTAGDRAVFEVVDTTAETTMLISTSVVGAVEQDRSRIGVALDTLGRYVADPNRYSVRLAKVVRRRYVPISQLVDDVPTLQAIIKTSDETQVIHRNVDYFLDEVREQACLRFVVGAGGQEPDVWEYEDPPDRLWAETTYIDNRPAIEGNFGIQADFTLEDLATIGTDLDYLSAVRGLWYAYLKGPTIFNLRAGTQILLGLPFAEEAGVITDVTQRFSPTNGRVLLQDVANPEIVRSYTYPNALELEINPETGLQYRVGDTVQQFAPIVEGAEVLDYVKSPKWFEGLLNQGGFYEIEKFHKFLVRVDSVAFGLSALLFVKSFISKVKPTYTLPLFVVRAGLTGERATEVNVTDTIELTGTLRLYDGACFDVAEGAATMWDEPRAAKGGMRSQYDANVNPDDAAPVYPTSQPVSWGFDKKYLCPEEDLTFIGKTTHAGGAVNTSGMFASGSNVNPYYRFGAVAITSVAAGPAGTTLAGSSTAVISNGNITELWVFIRGFPNSAPTDYTIVIQKDAGDVLSYPLSTNPTGYFIHYTLPSPIAVTTANTLTVRVKPTTGGARTPNWVDATVYLIEGAITWSGTKPAGKYLQVSGGWPAPWY
jgi:hypothetical protein